MSMNIYDIAKKAGVSIATVSRVMNGKQVVSENTRLRVTSVMEEMGYTPNMFARGLVVNSMKTIGIMTINVVDLYYANAIHTIELDLREKGYDVLLCNTGSDIDTKKNYLKLLIDKRVDGIILIGSVFREKTDNTHIIEAALKVPVVIINGDVQGENIYSILSDESAAVSDTIEYLSEKGHTEIVYIYDSETFSGFEKMRGFKEGMAKAGFRLRLESFVKTSSGITGGYNAIDKLFKMQKHFTAVIASEDVLAAGAAKRIVTAGYKIPDDMAVVGFNNSIIAECTTPELTSIDNNVEICGKSAVKILTEAIEKKGPQEKTKIPARLVIRNST
jgi:LacI family transcriptional regulator